MAGDDHVTKNDRDRLRESSAEKRHVAIDRYRVKSLVGQLVEDARRTVETAGGRFQVVEVDGRSRPITADLRLDRVNAVVRDGRVISANLG
jgi:hypothetical protein